MLAVWLLEKICYGKADCNDPKNLFTGSGYSPDARIICCEVERRTVTVTKFWK